MRKHPVRKFLGLTVLYAAVIVGIFVIQFKTESVITKTLGLMHITLAQSESDATNVQLHNQFKLSFNGFIFSANQESPALLYSTDRKESTPLVLKSYEEISEQTALFTFTDGSTLAFTQTGTSDDPSLMIASHPSIADGFISISYAYPSSFAIDNASASRVQYSEKESFYALTANEITENTLFLENSASAAVYASYDPTKVFTMDLSAELELADASIYNSTISQIKTNLLSKFSALISSGNSDALTENQVIAYVAEMAANGRYNEALDAIPDSFKKGNKRTYLSSPYFDNLVNMNKSLVIQSQKYSSLVNSSVQNSNLDIFTVENIDQYILRQKKTSVIKDLLSMPSSFEEFTPSLIQASGILNVYASIYQQDKELASLLESALDPCIQTITACCSLKDGAFTVTENEADPEMMTLIQTGKALIKAGSLMGHSEYTKTGYLIINQTLNSVASLSLDVITELYPVLVTDNSYYPHTVILGYYGSKAVWAWTCAQNLTYEINSEGIVSIKIKFPHERTNYIIFNNIPTFHSQIEIQQQMFRTDPRFENYNSSGYVYNADSQTLFIKSRHKSETELIRLFCDPTTSFTAAQ